MNTCPEVTCISQQNILSVLGVRLLGPSDEDGHTHTHTQTLKVLLVVNCHILGVMSTKYYIVTPHKSILPWHQLHLHIEYWKTSSCFHSWSQSDGRLSEPCPRSRPWFGLIPPRSAGTWPPLGGYDSGWGPGRLSPWFSLQTLSLLGVCHIL